MKMKIKYTGFITFAALTACGGGSGDTQDALAGKQATFHVGGTVSGLSGGELVLVNASPSSTSAETLRVSTNGSFRFPTPLPSQTRYNISVQTPPPGLRCTIQNADGQIQGAEITSVTVNCNNFQFTVGGVVRGLEGTGLELQNNGQDNLVIARNGSSDPAFTFATALNTNTGYNVSVLRNPTNPTQICEPTNGSGVIGTANVDNLSVSCFNILTVVGTTPSNGGMNIDRRIEPTINFSAPVQASSASANNISLFSVAGVHPSVVTTSGNQVTILPQRRLLPLTTYSMGIGTNIRGTNGERLLNSANSNFTTRDGQWLGSSLLETGSEDAGSQTLAVSENGNAIAVWSQYFGFQSRIWARLFIPGTGWGIPQLIDTPGNAARPRAAMNARGDAFVIWELSEGPGISVYSNRFTPANGWHGATPVETQNSWSAFKPEIAIDGSGNAIAVWVQNIGAESRVFTNRYLNDSGWGTASTLNNGRGNDPQIDCNEQGVAVAVWTEYQNGAGSVFASQYNSSEWSTPTQLGQSSAGAIFNPTVAINSHGQAISAWAMTTSGTNIWSTSFTEEQGWSAAVPIDSQITGAASEPHIAMNAQGQAAAIWWHDNGTTSSIYVNQLTIGGSWRTAVRIDSPGLGNATYPQIAIDNTGNAIAVWHQREGAVFNIYSARYSATTGWSNQTLLESGAGNSSFPKIAIDGSGSAIAAWSQYDGTVQNVFVNRFE